ncbi:MAG: hypothetical protein DYG94_15015 [Leptolyngbya sp. PLA3]|nr:hypothetical protein [Burkholderiales bacterium]MCE7970039.1 hypothetical protein [Leptolyngbya sp. PL-A3]
MEPRVIEARLVMANPFIDQSDDPFLELSRMAEILGPAEAQRIALRFADDIVRTDNWEERFAGRHRSVSEFLAVHPSGWVELYFLS